MDFDFIVVGAGIAGASICYELAQNGRVCLLDAEAQPGFHATGRSAALFAPSYGGAEFRALTRLSRSFYNSPPQGFCNRPLLRQRGCLYVARSDQLQQLGIMSAEIRASGGHFADLSKGDAIALVPLLRDGYLAAAAFDADAMDIDVDGLLQGFLRGARAAGSRFLPDSRVTAVRHRGGFWEVDARHGKLRAPVLVNAAGAWADEIAVISGARPVGLQPMRRTAALIDMPPGVAIQSWPAVIDVDEQFYFKPEAGKLLLSRADETPSQPCDAQADDLDVAISVDRVEAALNINVRSVSHSWAGLRTFAPDRAPVVGFDPQLDGFFWCAGQGGYGIQTAPAMGRIAAMLARREPLQADARSAGLVEAKLSPLRFAVNVIAR